MKPETRYSLEVEAGKALVYFEAVDVKIKAAKDPEVKLIYRKLKEAKEERYNKIVMMLEKNTVCI